MWTHVDVVQKALLLIIKWNYFLEEQEEKYRDIYFRKHIFLDVLPCKENPWLPKLDVLYIVKNQWNRPTQIKPNKLCHGIRLVPPTLISHHHHHGRWWQRTNGPSTSHHLLHLSFLSWSSRQTGWLYHPHPINSLPTTMTNGCPTCRWLSKPAENSASLMAQSPLLPHHVQPLSEVLSKLCSSLGSWTLFIPKLKVHSLNIVIQKVYGILYNLILLLLMDPVSNNLWGKRTS